MAKTYDRVCNNCNTTVTSSDPKTWVRWWAAHNGPTRVCITAPKIPAASPIAPVAPKAKKEFAKNSIFIDAQTLGKMCDTYSGDRLANGKPIMSYNYEGNLYVITCSSRGYQCQGYKIIPIFEWEYSAMGDIVTYQSRVSDGELSAIGLDGVGTMHKKEKYVLCGPKVTFVCEEV